MRKTVFLSLWALLPLWASPGEAAVIAFDNNIVNVGGTASVDQSGVTIHDGRVDAVGIEGTSQFSVTGACGGVGCLDVDTGDFIAAVVGNPNAFRYGGGGTVTVTGTAVGTAGILFNATFDLAQDVILSFDVDGAGQRLDTATLQGVLGGGTILTGLSTFLGISSLTTTGALTSILTRIPVTLTTAGVPVGTGSVGGNRIGVETTLPPVAVEAVPEPGSLILLGSGLIGLVRARRRSGS